MTAPIEPLTSTQLTILRQIAQGKTNKEIALTQRLSPHTVRHHVTEILARLAAADRAHAVAIALRTNLID